MFAVQKLYKWDEAHDVKVQELFWVKCLQRTKDNIKKERDRALYHTGIDHPGAALEHMHEYNPSGARQPYGLGCVSSCGGRIIMQSGRSLQIIGLRASEMMVRSRALIKVASFHNPSTWPGRNKMLRAKLWTLLRFTRTHIEA